MVLAALGSLPSGLPLEDGGHFPPKPQDFWQPLITLGHIGDYEVAITRPMVVVTISVLLLSWWLISTTKNAAIVPSKGQHYTELVYNFVRNDIAKDSIGSKDFFKFVPLLFALFVFILINNIFGVIPPVQFPTMSRVAFPIALTLIVYVVYHWYGVKTHHGFMNYLKWMIPLTLALRLFGNMFAGHMLLVVFIVGGWELFNSDVVGLKFVAIPAWLMAGIMTAFEALIQFLQAYVFVLLAASYFSDAVSGEH